MKVETDDLMTPFTAGRHFGMKSRGKPYSDKWVFTTMREMPEEKWPFECIDIDGKKFFREKKPEKKGGKK